MASPETLDDVPDPMAQRDHAEPLVVITTLASAAEATSFVRHLVDHRIVACGTLLAPGRSIYRWEGTVTESSEVVVLLKTTQDRWDALCAATTERHPYDVPELLALPVTRGLPAYLAWLADETRPTEESA